MNNRTAPVTWDAVVIADWDNLMKSGLPDSLAPVIGE